MLSILNKSPIFRDFKNAVARLEEVLRLKKTDVVRDSAVKRFEICFDLAWKTIKLYAKEQGMECYSPRECFKTAFQAKLIEHNEQWLQMIDDRNKAVHLYREEYAEELYAKLLEHLRLFQDLVTKF